MGCCGICFLLFLPHFRQIPTQPGDPKHRSADAAMRCLYFRPNPTPPRPHSHHTHFAHLNACASRVHLAELHGRFVRGRLASNPAVAGRLVAMLAPHDAHYARRVLDRMPHPSAPAWNCVIRGHTGRSARRRAGDVQGHASEGCCARWLHCGRARVRERRSLPRSPGMLSSRWFGRLGTQRICSSCQVWLTSTVLSKVQRTRGRF
jgi:hypothetical protein